MCYPGMVPWLLMATADKVVCVWAFHCRGFWNMPAQLQEHTHPQLLIVFDDLQHKAFPKGLIVCMLPDTDILGTLGPVSGETYQNAALSRPATSLPHNANPDPLMTEKSLTVPA